MALNTMSNNSHTHSRGNSFRKAMSNPLRELTAEITAAAASAYRTMNAAAASKSSKSSSQSNSLWLDDDSERQQQLYQLQASESESGSNINPMRGGGGGGGPSGQQGSSSASNNWSNSSTSSLKFDRGPGARLQNTFDIVGNYFYASPEMAGGNCIYNQAVDWWSVGVLLFHLLTGTTPFEGLTKASTLENIERMQCDWDVLPEDLSHECKDFLVAILTHNQETRLGTHSSEQVTKHPFFANIDFSTLYEGYGPYYPRPPSADETSAEFYSFTALADEDSLTVPDFSGGGGGTANNFQIRSDDKNDGSASFHNSSRDNNDSSSSMSLHGEYGVECVDFQQQQRTHSGSGHYSVLTPMDIAESEDELFMEFNYHPFN